MDSYYSTRYFSKGPQRYGTFKDAFNNRMIFVYGTSGTKEENEWSFNKARMMLKHGITEETGR